MTFKRVMAEAQTFCRWLLQSQISPLHIHRCPQFGRIARPDHAALLQDVVPVGYARQHRDILVDQQDRLAAAPSAVPARARSRGAPMAPDLPSPRPGSANADWSAAPGRSPASAARRPIAACRRDATARATAETARARHRASTAASRRRGLRQWRPDSPARSGWGKSAAPPAPGPIPVARPDTAAGRESAAPSSRISPRCVGSIPITARIVVVLPMPLRPSNVTTSPGATVKLTPNSTWLSP